MANPLLPATASPTEYDSLATMLLARWRRGDPAARQHFRHMLPRFRNPKVQWMALPITEEQLQAETFDMDDARAAVAMAHHFASWDDLARFATAMSNQDPEIYPFECAVDAVVNGDLASLEALLTADASLAHQRSRRVTTFDPPVHGAMLLHYIAANGVENSRQRTPANAVDIATALLDSGADPNAFAWLYGGKCTTLALLVSSSHPAAAGVHLALVELLVARGAELRPSGEGNWTSPVETALVFGFRDSAELLLRLGAPLSLAAAAALGRVGDAAALLRIASAEERHRALAVATQAGQVETTRLLLDAGEDPNRFNPPGTHAHTPPIHQAIWNGHLDVVRLLVERGARLDIRDIHHHSTPLGWARYAGHTAIVEYLTSTGAPV